jgi:hypothetical protein
MSTNIESDVKPENVAKPAKRKWRGLPNLPRLRSDEDRARDDAALLASGEELRTLAELAQELGVGSTALKALVWPLRTVRYLSTSRPVRYAARDVREAVQPHLERLRARVAAHLAEEAAGRARRAERAAAHAKVMAAEAKNTAAPPTPSKAPPAKHTSPLPPRTSPRRGVPEVTIMRRRPTP